jgi:hypothetical protein
LSFSNYEDLLEKEKGLSLLEEFETKQNEMLEDLLEDKQSSSILLRRRLWE